ncbi:hypothetical protein [Sphingomonas sp.]|uniref:hypothetical protein n=1 Tax=Sphingomonas sp. TaxID=28214 RepID=UPI003BAA381A
MGKIVGGILQAIVGVALIVTGNPLGFALLASGLGSVAAGILAPAAPKPESTESSVRTPRPPRVSSYGRRRLFPAGYWLYETATDGTAVDVTPIHDGKMAGSPEFYLNDDAVTLTGNNVNQLGDKRYAGNCVQLYWTDGSDPGAGLPAISAKVPSWSGRGDGVVMLGMMAAAVKDDVYLERYPNGAPTASMASNWQLCPDPSAEDPADESGWTYTENVIRQLMHYMMVREGVDYATKIAPYIDYWIAAAAVCDEAVALKSGGTEPRWRSCVAHKHTDTHKQVKAALLTACDGWMMQGPNGAYIVYAGKYYAPTVSIGPSEIVAFEWEGIGVDDDQATNELVCAYVSAAHKYATVETDAWTDEADIAARGKVLSDTFDPQVPSHGQVRRLAKRKLSKVLALGRGVVTTNIAGRVARGQRYINLRIEEAGAVFFDGVAEITALTRNMETGGVTFSWIKADPNIDAWNPATEEGEPAAVGSRVAPEALDTPSIVSVTPQVEGGGLTVRAQIEASGPDRADLTWFVRWRVDGDISWNEAPYPDLDPGATVELVTGVLPVNSIVELQVAYMVGDGRVSDWATTETVDTDTGDIIFDGGTPSDPGASP